MRAVSGGACRAALRGAGPAGELSLSGWGTTSASPVSSTAGASAGLSEANVPFDAIGFSAAAAGAEGCGVAGTAAGAGEAFLILDSSTKVKTPITLTATLSPITAQTLEVIRPGLTFGRGLACLTGGRLVGGLAEAKSERRVWKMSASKVGRAAVPTDAGNRTAGVVLFATPCPGSPAGFGVLTSGADGAATGPTCAVAAACREAGAGAEIRFLGGSTAIGPAGPFAGTL